MKNVSLLLSILLIVIGSMRIVSTYNHLSQVYDEPFHMLRGMHWQTGHAYVHTEHPPLGPLVFAFRPRLYGVIYNDAGSKQADGNSILYCNGEYVRTLTLFRMGNMIFFWPACFVLYAWAASRNRPWTGVIAVAFFTFCPTVLAHSGLATTDMPITAMLLCTVVSLERSLANPSIARWLIAGAVTGLVFVAKLSALLFVPVCFIALLCFSNHSYPSLSKRRVFVNGIVYMLALVAVVWSIYRFSIGPLGSIQIKEYSFEGFPVWINKLIVPAPEFVAGIVWAKNKLDTGHGDYFFGKTAGGGSPLFFPTVLAIKTPLVMLICCLISGITSVIHLRRNWYEWPTESLFISVLLLVSVIPSSVNIGVRHILPIYPFLSVLAADGMLRLVRCVRGNLFCKMFAVIGICTLTSWLIKDSISSHPHYLSHFNELAFGKPELIVTNSDLDWGQGVFELEKLCRERQINPLQVQYFGTADLQQHNLPSKPMPEDETYWLAISLTNLFRYSQFEKFRMTVPDAIVRGGSIRLYRVQKNEM